MTDTVDTTSTDYWTDLITEVVAETGDDYIYPEAGGTCVYQTYESRTEEEEQADEPPTPVAPSCIVGRVFYKHGERIDQLAEMQAALWAVEDQNASLVFEQAELLGEVPDEVIDGMVAAQEEQDNGIPYGIALERYKAVVSRNYF